MKREGDEISTRDCPAKAEELTDSAREGREKKEKNRLDASPPKRMGS